MAADRKAASNGCGAIVHRRAGGAVGKGFSMPSTVLRFVLPAAVLAVLVATSPADEIRDIIDQIKLDEYQWHLRILTGVDPVPGRPGVFLQNRYSFGDDIRIAGQWIYERFDSLNLDASFHTYDVRYGPNVIGELPGTSRPGDIYLVTAHYDTYHAANQYRAPGCDDNGSGTAAVLTMADVLSQYEFEGTLRFVAFSGEEQWMVGSQAYVRDARNRGENIVAALNLDMILHPGWDNREPDPDYDIDIGGNNDSQWLAHYMADVLDDYTSIDYQVHNDPNFVSDQWSFWQFGYDAVGMLENTPQEIWGGSNNVYHQITDTMDNPRLDWTFGLEVVRGGAAGMVGLAGLIPEPATLCLMAVAALSMVAVSRHGRRRPRNVP